MARKEARTYWVAGAVALVTLLTYIPSLENNFIVSWDDKPYILDNPYIRSLDAALVKWSFFDFYAANWHPLTWLSHALDYAVWVLNPLGHHLTNIILHALNAFLVVVLADRIIAADGEREKGGQFVPFFESPAVVASGVTGLLFGLHPLHVESVAWISERKDLLCGVFFFLAIIVYLRHVRNSEAAGGARHFGKPYFITLGLFTLALMSKSMAVTLPVVLLVLDWYPLKRAVSGRIILLEKIPFLVLSAISSILTLLAQRAGSALQSVEFSSLETRFLVAGKALAAYLGKMLLPLNLVPYYPYPHPEALLSPGYLAPILVAVLITVGCLAVARKSRFWLAAWGCYGITLLPVLGIIQVGGQEMADRYTYIPSFAPFLVLGTAAGLLWEKVKGPEKYGSGRKIIVSGLSVLIVVSLTFLTLNQISVWKSDLDLWTYVINKNPSIPGAYNNRGMIYGNMGQFDKALADLDRAVALDPNNASLFISHAFISFKLGRPAQALSDFSRACALGNEFACKAATYYSPGY